MTNELTWGNAVRDITSALHLSDVKTIDTIAKQVGLTESEVRNFLPLVNCRTVVRNGQEMYMLNSAPRKIKMRQAILLIMDAEKRINSGERDGWMSIACIKERISKTFKEIDAEKAVNQIYHLCNSGVIDKKGVRPNRLYRLLDNPNPVQSPSRTKTYTEQILEIADVVERLEARVKELEKENADKDKLLSLYKRHAKAVADLQG